VTYRIAGIDVHKRMLAVVIADLAVEGEYRFERRKVEPVRVRFVDWRSGWSPNKSRKWSRNRPLNIGDQYGRRSNGCGGPSGFRKVERGSCIWRRRSRIEERRDGRRIF
jgi:hypothetical protein